MYDARTCCLLCNADTIDVGMKRNNDMLAARKRLMLNVLQEALARVQGWQVTSSRDLWEGRADRSGGDGGGSPAPPTVAADAARLNKRPRRAHRTRHRIRTTCWIEALLCSDTKQHVLR